MCQKPGKMLIPTDKPQVYFVDVVKCINEVCSQRWRIQRCPLLRMSVAQVNESEHLNSWEIWYHQPTNGDRPTAYPGLTIAGGRAGGLDDGGEADWSTAPVKGHFDEFHNQWLTHWHSYQTADLFNRRNITSINCPKLHFASSALWFYGLEIFVVEFVL